MTCLVNNNPVYHEIPITDFQGNPLVEALSPPAASVVEAIHSLGRIPEFDESERDLPSYYRALLPARLLNFMFPTDQHTQLQRRIYGQVLSGYRWRNPATVHGQQLLHGERPSQDEVDIVSPRHQTQLAQVPATISFLTGLSGMGKSTLIRAIMRSMGSPVIRHSCYNGTPFNETQILYMMRNVPDQCSAKAVCKSFGDRTDELLGMRLYARLFEDKSMTRTHYVSALRKIVANHHVGALVIDEFQNISLALSGGKNEFLALILNLREELGIPIVLVGTYRAAAVLKEEASIARRLVEGGFHELKRPGGPEDKDWQSLCEIIWWHQWVRKPQELTSDVIEVLYKCSQGITGIMLNLFVTAQTSALEEGKETITPAMIEEVYQSRFRPLHPIIDILSRKDEEELSLYDDLYFDAMAKFKKDPMLTPLARVKAELCRKQEELSGSLPGPGKSVSKTGRSRKGKKLSDETLHDVLQNACNPAPFFGGQEA
ncbi:hypothetical protein GMLC_10450 [Geomonas limicola]|uniref:ORC1/DEAH AAA+ ATPase domain-containing protein n=1 Tax=Geomonas limicola TaxID=2740186 RepID=A0A6V8N4L6_9BACT|nr:AAA family ATPase [Geomonas limicola]GFO67466.1 hypothetical protein GMLC_10450 [Geomonas limicola]